MPLPLAETYRDAHARIDERVRALVADGRDPADIPVPACPGWSVHGVVSHLTGIAADALAGTLTGIPDDEHTARQVAERAGRPVTEVLGEWAALVDPLAEVVERNGIVPAAADVVTHDGDIREALGEGPPPEESWRVVARALCTSRIRGIDRPGTLTITSGPDTITGGAGGAPSVSVDVAPWELFRGVMSRRSTAQLCAWGWDGDPTPWLADLTVFGLREDDQPGAPVTLWPRDPTWT